MSDDATLSDFGSTVEADEGEADGADETGAVDGDGTDQADAGERDARKIDSSPTTGDDATADGRGNGAAVDAARSTYAWGTYACDRCEAETERVWREEESLVCPRCKSW